MAKAQPRSRPKRQRPHGHLPSGFQWRDGRPAWIPSPRRRKQGWKRCDLRDAWGKYLTDRTAAIGRAAKIAAAVEAWAAGHPVPAAYAAFAPPGALDHGATSGELSPRSIGALLEAYYTDPNFSGGGKIMGLAPKTQADYRSKIKRFLEVVADPAGTLAPAALETAVTRLKGGPIDIFLPPAFGEPGEAEIAAAYQRLRERSGEHMAYGALAAVSAWFGWCVKQRRVWPANPALHVARATPDGRIRVASHAELEALVAAAEAAGRPSIADAIILGVDLSWSEQDILALRWGQVKDGRVKHRRIKTGNAGNPPLLQIGLDRIEAIRRRNRDARVEDLHQILVCEMTGEKWNASTFQHTFRDIRVAAAKACPSVADLRFQDLRDTCVTLCVDAGLSVEEICSRTLHTPERAERVIFAHYGAIRQVVADRAGEKLNSHFVAMGYSFGSRETSAT